MNKIKVNLHSHVLGSFGPWWKKQFGIEGRNLAEVVTNKCIEKGLGIYAVTNDFPPEFRIKTRFEQLFNYARNLPWYYKTDKIGNNAFVIEREDRKRVYFLDGKSINVIDDGRKYELLTFGASNIPDGASFSETSRCLKDKGLLGIAEHPFAEGHHGAMDEEKLIELWEDKYIDAVEHNGKIAVPNCFSFVPEFNKYLRKCNQDLAFVADSYGIPMISNDDSDAITHIGTAYTEFPRDKIRLDKGENIVQDLNALIRTDDFDCHFGYLNFSEWFRYAVWIVTIKDHFLGLRGRYDKTRDF